jgi:hypothetical protein
MTIGASDAARIWRINASPLMSGKPRSRMITSGASRGSSLSAEAPFSASATENPRAGNTERSSRRTSRSSSMTRTLVVGFVIKTPLECVHHRNQEYE